MPWQALSRSWHHCLATCIGSVDLPSAFGSGRGGIPGFLPKLTMPSVGSSEKVLVSSGWLEDTRGTEPLRHLRNLLEGGRCRRTKARTLSGYWCMYVSKQEWRSRILGLLQLSRGLAQTQPTSTEEASVSHSRGTRVQNSSCRLFNHDVAKTSQAQEPFPAVLEPAS